jgi:hypothetical protein
VVALLALAQRPRHLCSHHRHRSNLLQHGRPQLRPDCQAGELCWP